MLRRPQLLIRCPYCATFQATHRADTHQEAADFLARCLVDHLGRLHPQELTAERREYPIDVLQG